MEKLSATRAKLVIDVPFADLTPAIRKAYRDVASQVSIPGFRKGHVPPALIDARLGRGYVLGEAVNAMLPELWTEAVKTHRLTPLGRPEVEVTRLEDGQDVELSAEVDVVGDFELPDFAAIAVSVEAVDDVEAQVDRQVERLRERFAEVTDVDRPAQAGDQVNLDLSASRDGQALADASATGVSYVIGSGGMLDGLDEAVTGRTAGQEAQFTSQLLGGDQAGQSADITVTVNAVQERRLPEVDDDFAQLVSQFDTVAQMRDDLRQSLAQSGTMSQVNAAREKVLDQALELAGIELPEAVVATETTARTTRLADQVKAAGLKLADYLAQIGVAGAATVEEFEAHTRGEVERELRSEILLSRLAAEQRIGVDQEDLTSYIISRAQAQGTTPDHEVQHMQQHDHLAEWMDQIRQAKALSWLAAQATVTDSDGQAVRLSAPRLVVPDEASATA
jgi:trigger factor